jgi:hypothetical protein
MRAKPITAVIVNGFPLLVNPPTATCLVIAMLGKGHWMALQYDTSHIAKAGNEQTHEEKDPDWSCSAGRAFSMHDSPFQHSLFGSFTPFRELHTNGIFLEDRISSYACQQFRRRCTASHLVY